MRERKTSTNKNLKRTRNEIENEDGVSKTSDLIGDGRGRRVLDLLHVRRGGGGGGESAQSSLYVSQADLLLAEQSARTMQRHLELGRLALLLRRERIATSTDAGTRYARTTKVYS